MLFEMKSEGYHCIIDIKFECVISSETDVKLQHYKLGRI
jgi:hypothetical protein